MIEPDGVIEKPARQTRPLRLRHNVVWSGVGSFVYAATQWLALAALAKLTSTFVVGQFTLGLAMVAPVYALTGLQLKAYLGTDIKNECSFGEYLGTRIVLTMVGFFAILLIAFLFVSTPSTRYVVLAVGAAKVIEYISDLTYGAFQKHQRMDVVASSLILRGVFAALLLAGVTWATNSLMLGVISLGLWWAAILFFHDLPQAAMFGSIVPQLGTNIFKIVRRTYPMAIALALGSLTLAMPRYLLQHYYDEATVGIYSALFYIVTANVLLGAVLAQAVSPKLARVFNENRKHYLNLLVATTAVLVSCGILLLVVTALFGKLVLATVYTEEYSHHSKVFVLLAGGGIFAGAACVLDYGLVAARYIKVRVLISAVALSLGLFVGLFLIPQLQLLGAAVSFSGSAVALFLGDLGVNIWLCRERSNISVRT